MYDRCDGPYSDSAAAPYIPYFVSICPWNSGETSAKCSVISTLNGSSVPHSVSQNVDSGMSLLTTLFPMKRHIETQSPDPWDAVGLNQVLFGGTVFKKMTCTV